MIVESLLKTKGTSVYTIERRKQLSETVRLLADKRIGAAVVVDQVGALCGVLSERDVVQAIARQGSPALSRPVSDFMSVEVVTCRLHDTVDALMELMTKRRIRHLPVVEDGAIRGIVSIGDVVKWRIAETVMEAEALREYIATS
jgi:CBS domain-containing protein